MANFGDSVSALVDTYTKCLRLLQAFKGGAAADARSLQSRTSEVDSLRTSVRSDRARVRRAYSSRLWAKGKRLEKGDSRSKSAIRRILERLKNAITNLLSFTRAEGPVVDYASLMSLSNTSRIDAIKAMDRLSSRLSSTSLAKESRRHQGSTSKRNKREAGTQIPDSPTQSNGPSRNKSPGQAKAKGPTSAAEDCPKTTPAIKSKISKGEGQKKSSKVKQDDRSPTRLAQTESIRDNPSIQKTSRISYISYTSTSSDSTKLGEIPYRRSRLTKHTGHDGYPVQPVFPLNPHRLPLREEKRGLLRRIFGSRES